MREGCVCVFLFHGETHVAHLFEDAVEATSAHLLLDLRREHAHELTHVAGVDLATAVDLEVLHTAHDLLERLELCEQLEDITDGSS